VHIIGEAVPETFVTLEQQTLSVEAEATNIPTGIDVSVAGLTVGSQIHARDVVLPAGVTLVTDEDALVVNVSAATTAEEMEALLRERHRILPGLRPWRCIQPREVSRWPWTPVRRSIG